MFYAVALKDGAREVTEVDGSTDAVMWIPLADLQDDTMLSPAAADALRMLEQAEVAGPGALLRTAHVAEQWHL
ncbi:hypothetical protein [Streptomyces luridiscabiei]|uniref:hypothetical protein n=1 Tax=Streptomyces luridiscabiei TaxID=164114 RepID=UPI000A850D51|nr:hypothetical protein [Streptomyces luridiscabiei]